MKEETNATGNTWTPNEAEMNEMHDNAWQNFHAEAREAKQEVNRRYAKMVNTFGSYKKMPEGVKEILKEDYTAHKAKWGENGEEQQKRFGVKADEPVTEPKQQPQSEPEKDQTQLRQEFLHKAQEQRQQQQSRSLEYEL